MEGLGNAMRKKTPLTRSLMAAASIVALSAVMYGCSSSGENAANTRADEAEKQLEALLAAYDGDGILTPAALDKLETDLATANGEVTRLTGELSASQDNAADLQTKLDAEMAEVTRLEGELATANGNVTRLEGELSTSKDNAADLQTKLDAEMAEVTRLEGELSTAQDNATDLQTQLDAANDKVDELTEDLAAETKRADDLQAKIDQDADDSKSAAAIAKAKKVNTAIRAAGGEAPDYKVEASASELVVKSTGYTDGGAESGMPAGWRGRTLTKSGIDGDNTLVVYSDIANATPTLIGVLYNGIVENNTRKYTVDPNRGTKNAQEIQWTDVMRDSAVSATDPKGTGEADDVHSFTGSVRGVSGTFTCTGPAGDCDLPARNSDGSVTAPSDTPQWRFAPTDANAMIDVQDAAYLSLGWWLDADGTYSFDTFAMGHGDLEQDIAGGDSDPTVGNVDGKATYKGAAAGKYSMADTLEDTAEAAHWTATATLTADFDIDNTPADDTEDDNGVKLTGEITDFMSGGESLSKWKVTLAAVDANGATAGTPSPTDFVAQTGATGQTPAVATWSLGGAAKGAGTWNYTWRGPQPTDGSSTAQPGAVTGTFDASIGSRAHIVGAFGATLVPASN